jgi:hypothetical protein
MDNILSICHSSRMSNPNQSIMDEIAAHNRKRRSLLNRIRVALVLSSAELFDYRLAQANWAGIPPEGLTWNQAWIHVRPSIVPMVLVREPTHCPICALALVKYQSDYQRIENGGQHMVYGVYCQAGHWTYLDCA